VSLCGIPLAWIDFKILMYCSDDEKNPQWKVWQLRDGMTPCYRDHISDVQGPASGREPGRAEPT
jgi:hypothetical protein